MPQNPDMRASDQDRDRFADVLRDNYAVGRLTQDELNERLEGVYRARTLGGLQELTADLPEHDLYDLPIPAAQRATVAKNPSKAVNTYNAGLKASWATYGAANLICFSIWLITVIAGAELIYPWFLWVAGPWGAVLLAGTVFGPRPPKD